jgi:hypothetical protein
MNARRINRAHTAPVDCDQPWPLDELVRAQRLACEGQSFDDIAAALGRSSAEVRRKLDPDPPPRRADFASVGYPHLKRRQ